MSRTVPSSVTNSVSRMSVSAAVAPAHLRTGVFGAIFQRPFSGVPSSDAKHASESKSGRQRKSIEPSLRDERGRVQVADQRMVFDEDTGLWLGVTSPSDSGCFPGLSGLGGLHTLLRRCAVRPREK